jgi:hypothetical protein
MSGGDTSGANVTTTIHKQRYSCAKELSKKPKAFKTFYGALFASPAKTVAPKNRHTSDMKESAVSLRISRGQNYEDL